jgi:hypothetical protein
VARKPESPAAKSRRRRRQINRREEDNAKLRKKYATNSEYRFAKLAARREQTARLTTSDRAVLNERACAKRWRDRQFLLRSSSWPKHELELSVILTQELLRPMYIIERDGKREIENWPPNDLAQFWPASSAAEAAVPRGHARFAASPAAQPAAENRAAGSLSMRRAPSAAPAA